MNVGADDPLFDWPKSQSSFTTTRVDIGYWISVGTAIGRLSDSLTGYSNPNAISSSTKQTYFHTMVVIKLCVQHSEFKMENYN